MKKALKILGIIVGVLVIAMVAIPFFVNVDKFRPQIVKATNERINGTLELGKLTLSLWGRVHVSIDGLHLKDRAGQSVLAVKDASFDIPFTSVLSGSPQITLTMDKPEIVVIKRKDGKLNVMSLMKETGATPEPGTDKPASASSPGQVELPSIAVNSRIGMSVSDAKVIYRDDAMALSNTIDNFNLRVKDLSLSRKTELEMWADLKTTMGKGKEGTRVEGPLKLIANLLPDVSGGEFKSAQLDALFTADDLEIQQGALFHKRKGVPFNFKFSGSLTQTALALKEAALKFHNADVVVAGNFDKEKGADFTFNAKPVELKSWSELVPMLKEYELEGKLALDGAFKGKPEALQYNAKLKIDSLAMKGPMLKAKPVINGDVSVVTDKVEHFGVNVKGPGTDLNLSGKMISFTAPQLTFALTSKGMDLDQWIEFPKPTKGEKEKTASAPASGGSSGGEGARGSEADYDAMVDPLRTNPMMKAMVVDGSVAIPFVKAMDIRVEDIAAKIQMKNLVASLNGLRMKMYDGSITGGFTVDLKPKNPQYTMQLAVTGFNMRKAVESQFQSFKNTVVGKLNTTISGGGSSFNASEIKKNLQIKGEFKVADAQFKSIDVAKMASEAVNKSIGKIAEKVPAVAGKSINVPGNAESRYEVVSSNFTMAGGVLEAPNFVAKAAPKSGIDIRGYTKMGLLDESLDAKWELIDAQKMLPPVNTNLQGIAINNALAKGDNEPVILPVEVGCKWSAPCTNYAKVPEYLASVVAARVGKAAGAAAQSKAQEAIQKAVGDKAAPILNKGIKGLFGN